MSGLVDAIALHTRIPIRTHASKASELARSVPWFPVVGAGLGASIAAVYIGLSALLPGFLAAVMAAVAGALLTGALHEDGLADVADAFGAGGTKDRRLEILDDPRLGTYGVIAVASSFLLRAGAIAVLDITSAIALLPAAHALSRAGAIVLMIWLPLARPDGLGARYAAYLTGGRALCGIAAGAVISAVAIGPWSGAAFVLAGLAILAMGFLARAKLGGVTGDVLGATQQIVELAILMLGAAVVHSGWGDLMWLRR